MREIVESLHGWCDEKKAQILFDLVKQSDSKVTIELGVFGGRSLIPMALAHKQKGTGFIIGFDAWKPEVATEGTNAPENDEFWRKLNHKEIYDSCQEGIFKYGVEDYCNTVRMKSRDAAVLIADNIVDVLHQDSNHNIETITEELSLWMPKLKLNGYWIADDTNWKEAVEGYAKLPDYGLELIKDFTSWQIWKKVK